MYLVDCKVYFDDSVLGSGLLIKLEKRTKSAAYAKVLARKFIAECRAKYPEHRFIVGYRPVFNLEKGVL